MAFGDFVKKIYVKIQVDGAEEAKAQMEEVKLEADHLSDGVKIPIKVDKDGLNTLDRLDSLLARIASSSTNVPGPIPALPTPAVIAGLVAALAALPFIAQAAAGAITLGLGGALVGLGVYAEMGTRSVQYQFSQLVSGKDGIAATLKNISPAFGQALTTILSAARTFVPQFIRDFGPALDAISGPLKQLGVMIAGTLASPQIRTSIIEMGKAFGGILKALTPLVPGMFSSIANGFTNVARAIEKNPKPIADLIAGLAHLIGMLLDTIAWLTQVAAYIELHWIPAWRRAQSDILNWTMDVGNAIAGFVHMVEHDIDNLVHWWLSAWNALWSATIGLVIRGIQTVVSWFRGLPGRIVGAFGNPMTILSGVGAGIMGGLLSGLKSAWSSVTSFISGIGGWIASHKGPITVDEVLLRPHGQAIMRGLVAGLQDGIPGLNAQLARTTAMVGSYGGYGGGVLRLEVVGGGGGMLDQLFIAWLKKYVRVAGGGGPQSVQRALGAVWH